MLNDLDPQSYLRRVLARIANNPIKRIGELLPWYIEKSPELAAEE
ncbi:transposase domain-containing protein [Rhizobium leguminosarum]